MTQLHIGMVGYGEVGKIFTAGLLPQVAHVSAWDLSFELPERQGAERDHAARAGVRVSASLPALCQQANLLISAVTASNTLAVAQAAAPHLRAGTVFLDLNSASPGTKQQAAELVNATGAL